MVAANVVLSFYLRLLYFNLSSFIRVINELSLPVVFLLLMTFDTFILLLCFDGCANRRQQSEIK